MFPQSSSWCPLGEKQPLLFSLCLIAHLRPEEYSDPSLPRIIDQYISVLYFSENQHTKKGQINVKKKKKKEMDCVIALPIYCDHASSLASSTRPNVHSKTMLCKMLPRYGLFCSACIMVTYTCTSTSELCRVNIFRWSS